MERHALLIAVGRAKDEAPIDGVYQDVDRMQRYLLSATGGAWEAGEIEVVTDIDKEHLLWLCRQIGFVDYSFVLFSGHGCEVEISGPFGLKAFETHVVCSDSGIVSLRDLGPPSDRRLLFLDCCRGVLEEKRRLSGLARELIKVSIDRKLARIAFDRAIERSEMGVIKLFGCDFGREASDKYSFIKAMIQAGSDLAITADGITDVNTAFDRAVVIHRFHEEDQKPKLDGGRRRMWFPFSVGETH